MDIDVKEPAPDDGPNLRRRLLGIGIGGAAVSLLPFLAGRAGATTPPSSTTTTTTPPKRPSADDTTLLSFAQGIELAIRDLYDVALGVKFDDVTRAVVATIRQSHEQYASALSGLLGRNGTQTRDPIFDDLRASFSGDASKVIDAAYSVESSAVATHTEILGQLQGTDGAALLASILIVEARHGTVLASLNKKTSLDDLLVTNEADALTPAKG